jgi:hypothetical protein
MRILTVGQLDGYQRRKDRSISLRFITQEKTSSEVMEIDQLLDTYGIIYFRGEENLNQEEIAELDAIEMDLYDQPKSQSQRLRNVFYKLWKQEGGKGEFKEYYKAQTERIIEHFKSKLNDE